MFLRFQVNVWCVHQGLFIMVRTLIYPQHYVSSEISVQLRIWPRIREVLNTDSVTPSFPVTIPQISVNLITDNSVLSLLHPWDCYFLLGTHFPALYFGSCQQVENQGVGGSQLECFCFLKCTRPTYPLSNAWKLWFCIFCQGNIWVVQRPLENELVHTHTQTFIKLEYFSVE